MSAVTIPISGLEGYGAAEVIQLDCVDARLRPASQTRARVDAEAVEEYAAALDELPPVLLIRDRKGQLWVVDGRHRITSALAGDRSEILARVKRGTYFEAFREACHANLAHGVRVTNEDKQYRVREALAIPEIAGLSDNLIAEMCAVSQPTVSKYRSAPTNKNYKLGGDEGAESDDEADAKAESPKRLGKDGKARKAPKKGKSKKGKAASDDEPQAREPLPGQADLPLGDESEGDDDRNLAAWGDNLEKLRNEINVLCVSIPRRGGFGNLARHCSPGRVRSTMNFLKRLRDACDAGIVQLEELLR